MLGARSLTSRDCLGTAPGRGEKKHPRTRAVQHSMPRRQNQDNWNANTRRHLHADERSAALLPAVAQRGERGEPARAAHCRLPGCLVHGSITPAGRGAGSCKGGALHRNMATANWGLERRKDRQTDERWPRSRSEGQKGRFTKKISLHSQRPITSACCNRRFSSGLKTALDV